MAGGYLWEKNGHQPPNTVFGAAGNTVDSKFGGLTVWGISWVIYCINIYSCIILLIGNL